MASTLMYSGYQDCSLVWCDDEEGEGGFVGQEFETAKTPDAIRTKLAEIEAKLASQKNDIDFEYFAVEVAVAKFVLSLHVHQYTIRYGWKFETEANAKKAMAIAKTAIKVANAEKPWPEWALQAVANGWKAPKGWKP